MPKRLSKAGVKNLVLKDQPNGECLKCRWNGSASGTYLDCDIPRTLLVNPICIGKLQLAVLQNIAASEDADDDWRSQS